ncbi:hypothetical protein GUITHDRAFT_102033 [Guillardia theta CCMP2712]|uniref:RAP domain-containing protein n=2 Tax=Guillardia theta TaxID=55529 RepID=L1JUN9_GUITC|nr:hypothetical protein GUITHDRAFT_102033 [Guillardia theta CCMP2712]EKX52132.1 hypothetical protein GUITHDRAFT_102033 [Guillardia theta CCMP2712]|eukprot:XP_005839112.1 hypothetical protein GUITHDRAFT_102033 [Guillardia theta CCMP2712]
MVEVDGPLHFAFKTRKALGSTKMKRRHLQESRSQGYRLLVIPYWEWNSQKMVDDVDGGGVKKVQYLKTKLESIGETRR